MKFLALAALLGIAVSYTADQCPQDLEVKCMDDINQSYKVCEKAAEQKGKDFPADLECMKYLATVEKDCWPCICFIAKKEGWKIKGCTSQLSQ